LKIMALDVGRSRIGVAFSDPDQTQNHRYLPTRKTTTPLLKTFQNSLTQLSSA
jgi:RNase H-fold protein (predicted Holliday junction resolvase)